MAGSIAFSGKAIIVKLAYRYGVDAVTLIMYRMLFALPLFALLAWWAGRGRPALTRRDWLVVTGLGFSGYYLASFLDFAGLAYITASLERLILYLNPTLVLGARRARLQAQRPRRASSSRSAVSYCGVLLVFGHEVSFRAANAALGAGARLRERGQLCDLPRRQRRGGQAHRRAAAHRPGDERRLPVLHRPVRRPAADARRSRSRRR